MPLKLSPLQSRLAASLIASIVVVALYFAFTLPQFVYAADVDSIKPEDHNHDRLRGGPILEFDFEDFESRDLAYEAQFEGVDRGIIGRAAVEATELLNNRVVSTNIQQGQLVSYVFTNASLWGPKSTDIPRLPSPITLDDRDVLNLEEEVNSWDEEDVEIEQRRLIARQTSPTNRTLYVSVNTCTQPVAVANTTTNPPPQLQLYISHSSNNTQPGPGQDSKLQNVVELTGGYVLYTVNATGDTYIGVYAKNDTAYSSPYNAEIAASIDAPYHYWWNSTDPNLFLVDSDDRSALLYTDPFIASSVNTTLEEEWLNHAPPFTIFVGDFLDPAVNGLQNSYCGLQKNSAVDSSTPGGSTSNLVTSITTKGLRALPRQQFYMDGLAPGKTYRINLALKGNLTSSGTVGGGGQVFTATEFTTLSDGNCQVITDLSFCDQVAYSVPSNPNNFPNMSSLAAFYDNSTQAIYANFKKVLAQIPCETTSSAQYSLARTCNDCANDYKAWLCAVNIPRCSDYTSTLPWLHPRAMGQPFPNGTFLPQADLSFANQSMAINGSRNVNIDKVVVPGPYKEVLPCDDLCYTIVQSCPASMGFSCPQPGNLGFNTSYGLKPLGGRDGIDKITNITCNKPGSVYFNAAGRLVLPSPLVLVAGVALGIMLL